MLLPCLFCLHGLGRPATNAYEKEDIQGSNNRLLTIHKNENNSGKKKNPCRIGLFGSLVGPAAQSIHISCLQKHVLVAKDVSRNGLSSFRIYYFVHGCHQIHSSLHKAPCVGFVCPLCTM